jgi:hypothetical protein
VELLLAIGARFTVNESVDVTGFGVIKTYDLPQNAVVVNISTASSLSLTFSGMTLTLTFNKTDSEVWSLSSMALNYGESGHAESDNAKGLLGISAHTGKAFQCKTKKDLKLDDNVSVTIFNVEVQPYLEGQNDFSQAQICEEDKQPNNIVPIAVGAALAALVVIVLILYLIGRRKHQRGYQTV